MAKQTLNDGELGSSFRGKLNSMFTELYNAVGSASSASSGAGAPTSTPDKVGDIYVDTTNDDAYIATGTSSSADWEISQDGGSESAPNISSGAGAPTSTPGKVGDIYIDTTNDDAYTAVGTSSSADWEKNNDGTGGGGGATHYATVSAAEAATGHSDNEQCYVEETETYYRYEAAGSALTDDNTYILSTADGGDTRWKGVAGKYVYEEVHRRSVVIGPADQNGSVELPLANQGTGENGNWRFAIDDNGNLVLQARVSGSWATKKAWSAPSVYSLSVSDGIVIGESVSATTANVFELSVSDGIVMGESVSQTHEEPLFGSAQGKWKLSDDGVWLDDSTNSNDLSETGTVTTATGPGSGADKAALFNAAGEKLTITDGSQSGLDITGSLTLACKLYISSSNEIYGTAFGKWFTTGDQRSYTFASAGAANNMGFWLSDDGTSAGQLIKSIGGLSYDTWYSFVGTYNHSNGEMILYVDGSKNGSSVWHTDTDAEGGTPLGIFNSTSDLSIGSSGVNDFAGRVADAVVSNTAWTAQQASDYHDLDDDFGE